MAPYQKPYKNPVHQLFHYDLNSRQSHILYKVVVTQQNASHGNQIVLMIEYYDVTLYVTRSWKISLNVNSLNVTLI